MAKPPAHETSTGSLLGDWASRRDSPIPAWARHGPPETETPSIDSSSGSTSRGWNRLKPASARPADTVTCITRVTLLLGDGGMPGPSMPSSS
jgi:hypothetical protein